MGRADRASRGHWPTLEAEGLLLCPSVASAATALGAVTLQSQIVLHLREGVLRNEAQTQSAAGNHKSLRPLPPLGGYDPPGIMECNWE